MKKKVSVISLIMIMLVFLVSCSESKKSDSKEYEIDEFGSMYEETNTLFEKESEYLTDEELYSDKGYEIYKKCSDEIGLPFNTEITLRGKKAGSTSNFCVETVDGEYSVPCFFAENEPDISLFIKNGESIVVKGIFSENPDSYGCLTNATVISPKEIDTSFDNNVAKILADYDDIHGIITVQGEVSSITTLDEFEYFTSLYDDINYEHQDYYYDTVVGLEGDDGIIYFMYNKETFGELNIGDKIATQGYVNDLLNLKKADGTTSVMWGLMGNVYEVYTFN